MVRILGRAGAVSRFFLLRSLVSPSLVSADYQHGLLSVCVQSASVGAKELSALGIKIVEVDYNSPSSLAFALEGIDVVLSTLAGEGWAAQLPLALAGKKAGVQLFVPRLAARPTCFCRSPARADRPCLVCPCFPCQRVRTHHRRWNRYGLSLLAQDRWLPADARRRRRPPARPMRTVRELGQPLHQVSHL